MTLVRVGGCSLNRQKQDRRRRVHAPLRNVKRGLFYTVCLFPSPTCLLAPKPRYSSILAQHHMTLLLHHFKHSHCNPLVPCW